MEALLQILGRPKKGPRLPPTLVSENGNAIIETSEIAETLLQTMFLPSLQAPAQLRRRERATLTAALEDQSFLPADAPITR